MSAFLLVRVLGVAILNIAIYPKHKPGNLDKICQLTLALDSGPENLKGREWLTKPGKLNTIT